MGHYDNNDIRFTPSRQAPLPPAGRPANHYHDICSDMDYRTSNAQVGYSYDRLNHSPLRSPSTSHSPPAQPYRRPDQNSSPAYNRLAQGTAEFEINAIRTFDARREADPAYLGPDPSCSNPLRRKTPSPVYDGPRNHNNYTEPANKQVRIGDSSELREEIQLLNARLDRIDLHCKQFS